MFNTVPRPVARILHGGGGGGVLMSASSTYSERCRCKNVGVFPPGNFEKTGYLRQHFVRFEDSLLGNKVGKSEVHKVECI